MLSLIASSIAEHLATIQSLQENQPAIAEVAQRLVAVLKKGGKILICGNGGSAADSQHFAAELVGRFEKERRGLRAIALSTDTSCLTAIGNDYGFAQVFARQVEALAAPADVLFGISTSGHSENVLRAIAAAKNLGCLTCGLTGRDGGPIAAAVDLNLNVPVQRTARIQEAHLTILHILCELIETKFMSGKA